VQHLSLDQMRAAELGVPVLRSAITGISAVIDANGRVLDRLEIFESGVIVSEVSIPSGTTLYRRFGELLFTLPLMLWGGSYAAARLLTPSRRPDRFVR
jgi:apolipoprotein N-acyltransferase